MGKPTICYGWPYYYIGLYNVMCIQINGKSSVSKINYCNNIKWFLSFNMFVFFMVFNDTFNNSASSLKQQSTGKHMAPLGHITMIPSRPDCFFSIVLHAMRRSNKYQLYILWFDPIVTRTHGLPHSRQAR